jgi:hypothetical protein
VAAAFIADECPDAHIVLLFALGVTTDTTTPRQGTCRQGARFASTIPIYTIANKKRTTNATFSGSHLNRVRWGGDSTIPRIPFLGHLPI